ncbi:MAG: hypothetical protein IH918_09920 [Acidobacteria bacterium]|nr:hypothetical protein [Acidobacteriota bacterium]
MNTSPSTVRYWRSLSEIATATTAGAAEVGHHRLAGHADHRRRAPAPVGSDATVVESVIERRVVADGLLRRCVSIAQPGDEQARAEDAPKHVFRMHGEWGLGESQAGRL